MKWKLRHQNLGEEGYEVWAEFPEPADTARAETIRSYANGIIGLAAHLLRPYEQRGADGFTVYADIAPGNEPILSITAPRKAEAARWVTAAMQAATELINNPFTISDAATAFAEGKTQ
jgi:hypothetical protein